MHITQGIRCWAAVLTLVCATTAQAHVDWTRVNSADPDLLSLYHFTSTTQNPGGIIESDSCVPLGTELLIGTPAGLGLLKQTDLVEPIFGARSLQFRSTQSLESPFDIPDLDDDLTIEFWFKWDAGLTSSSIEIGLRSGAKIRMTRHVGVPANDQFGIQGTHGDYRDAPGFADWPTVGLSEAPLDEWMHVALTIHSTGMHFNTTLSHDVYSTGSLARFYLNGHPTGAVPHTLDLTDLRVHPGSKLRINNLAGGIKIDEVTIWTKDWSGNGTVGNPFGNGRGNGCNFGWTQTNTSDPRLWGHFQFDEHNHLAGERIYNNPCLADLPLVIGAFTTGAGMDTAHDTPGAIFDDHAMLFDGAQDSSTTITLLNTGGDVTIESWVRWDAAMTTSSIEFGLRSGPKIRLSRDLLIPANDEFGISATHGDFLDAPGFISWARASQIAAGYDDWFHVAMTIHSTGISCSVPLAHDVFNPGSTARFFINGQVTGPEPRTLDITGVRAHDTSRLQVKNLTGRVKLDEVTIWNADLTNDGALMTVFNNGRGTGLCNAVDESWLLYE